MHNNMCNIIVIVCDHVFIFSSFKQIWKQFLTLQYELNAL